MWQSHSIVLWKKADEIDKTFDEIAKESFEVFALMQDFPAPFKPIYLTAKSKRYAKQVPEDFAGFKELLRKSVNHKGKVIFEELGYTLSFFTSLVEDDSCSISMRVGNKSLEFYNTLVINFPFSYDVFVPDNAKRVSDIFSTLVKCFKPFWGCVSNAQITKLYGPYLHDHIPSTVHWVNFWSQDIRNQLGEHSVLQAISELPETVYQDGILMIRDAPIDIYDDKSVEYQRKCHMKFLPISAETMQ